MELPTAVQGDEALVDVGRHEGMDVQAELADTELFADDANLTFQRIGEEIGGLNLSGASARRAFLFDLDIHGRTNSLAGDLHQSKLGKGQNVVARTVFLHVFDHSLVELLAILGLGHVDEIDYDDAAHVAQTQLAR